MPLSTMMARSLRHGRCAWPENIGSGCGQDVCSVVWVGADKDPVPFALNTSRADGQAFLR